jgi:hypothetical protein
MAAAQQQITYLQEKAAHLRRLSAAHGAAGNAPIAQKLAEVAQEFEARATALESAVRH